MRMKIRSRKTDVGQNRQETLGKLLDKDYRRRKEERKRSEFLIKSRGSEKPELVEQQEQRLQRRREMPWKPRQGGLYGI